MKRITDARLDAFISGKYDWKNLPPKDVLAMAIELRRLRSCSDSIIAVGKLLESGRAGVDCEDYRHGD